MTDNYLEAVFSPQADIDFGNVFDSDQYFSIEFFGFNYGTTCTANAFLEISSSNVAGTGTTRALPIVAACSSNKIFVSLTG